MSNIQRPRVVAHRGWSSNFPENSLPAFAAAFAVGADEIEFDVRASKDGVLVACHDSTTERTSDSALNVAESTAAELGAISMMSPDGSLVPGLGVPDVADVLGLFYGRVGMNVHVKSADALEGTLRLLRQHIATDGNLLGVYVASTPEILREAVRLDESIPRCMLDVTHNADEAVDAALDLNCARVQFRRDGLTGPGVKRALEHGIVPNLYYADEIEDVEHAVSLGVIGILTNRAGQVISALRGRI